MSEFKPGDTNTGRFGKGRLSKAVAGLVLAGASAGAIYHQFLFEKESAGRERLTAYLDGAGIWTICDGLTRIYNRPVRPGDKATSEECHALDAAEQARGLAEMQAMVKPDVWAGLSPAAQAGVSSFCVHNIGASKCRLSTFLRLLNEGRRNEACAQITLWIKDAGRDCRERKNGCLGQVERRRQEDELCMEGA